MVSSGRLTQPKAHLWRNTGTSHLHCFALDLQTESKAQLARQWAVSPSSRVWRMSNLNASPVTPVISNTRCSSGGCPSMRHHCFSPNSTRPEVIAWTWLSGSNAGTCNHSGGWKRLWACVVAKLTWAFQEQATCLLVFWLQVEPLLCTRGALEKGSPAKGQHKCPMQDCVAGPYASLHCWVYWCAVKAFVLWPNSCS